MASSLALLLGLVAGVHVFNGGYYAETDAAGKRDNLIAWAKFVEENKQEIAAFAAVTDYAVNGNNPKSVTENYQELASNSKWLKTIKFSHDTEGHWATFGKKLNNLPSGFATVKGKTRDAVIAKQKTFFSSIVSGVAETLKNMAAHEGSHDQKMLELSSVFLKLSQGYYDYHSNYKNNENSNDLN